MADIGHFHAKFVAELGVALKEYVSKGGRVAFPTSEGLMLIKVLKPLFNVQWETENYRRINWRAPTGRGDAIDRVFPLKRLISSKSKASEIEYSAKACSYKNVPPHEAFFGNIGEGHSKFPLLDFVHKAGADEPEGMWNYSVAVHKHDNGSIAFFGDVNCEPHTRDSSPLTVSHNCVRLINSSPSSPAEI